MDYDLEINPNLICRMCLAENLNLKSIFCNEIVDGQILPFPKVLDFVTNIKADKTDGFPEKLCTTCRAKIIEAYVFINKCKKSKELLCKILNIPSIDCIKLEPQHRQAVHTVTASTQTVTDTAPSTNTTETQTETALELYTSSTQTSSIASTSILTQTPKCTTNTTETQTEEVQPTTLSDNDLIEILSNNGNKLKRAKIEPTVVQSNSSEYATIEIVNENFYNVKKEITEEQTDEDENIFYYEQNEMEEENIHLHVDTDEEVANDVIFDLMESNENVEYLIDDEDEDEDANENQQEVYEIVETLSCDLCKLSFENEAKWDLHVKQNLCSAAPRTSRKRKNRDMDSPSPSVNKHAKWCRICKLNLQSVMSLEDHMQFHRQTLPIVVDSHTYYRCGNCCLLFLTELEFRNHFDDDEVVCTKSGNESSSMCTDYQYLSEPEIDNDLDGVGHRICSCIKENSNKYICDFCNSFEGQTLEALLIHFNELHMVEIENSDCDWSSYTNFGTLHHCSRCNCSFQKLRDAVTHLFFHFEEFQCPYDLCTDSYNKFYLLNQHMERNHVTNRQYPCSHCGDICATYIDYRFHLRNICEMRTFECDLCDRKYFTKTTLSTHRKYHINDKRFKCKFCGKRFIQGGDLKIHERVHTGEKPYKCVLCNKAFRSIGNRKDHMSTHEETNKFECSICSQQFKSERTLRGHWAIHSDSKKFACEVCDKRFHRKYHVTLHMKTHTHAK